MPAKGDSEIKNKKSYIEKAQDTWGYLKICFYNPENGTCLKMKKYGADLIQSIVEG